MKSLIEWIEEFIGNSFSPPAPPPKQPIHGKLCLEQLESRLMPTTYNFFITNNGDGSGGTSNITANGGTFSGSLRYCITELNLFGTNTSTNIMRPGGMQPIHVVTLNSQLPKINKPVTFTGSAIFNPDQNTGFEIKAGTGANYPVLRLNSTGSITLRGMTLTGGNTASSQGWASLGNGGGLISTGGNNSLSSVSVTGNYAANNGGGIYVATGSLIVNNKVIVEGNSCGNNGGGVYDRKGSITASGTIAGFMVENNKADGNGGGICNQSGTITINKGVPADCIIYGNTAIGNGGGVYNGGGTNATKAAVFIINSGSISNNTAGVNGGGIYNSYPALGGQTNKVFVGTNASSSISISGNLAAQGGGLYLCGNSTAKLYWTTVEDNTAGTGAGVAYTTGAGGSLPYMLDADFTDTNDPGGVPVKV